MEKNEIIALLQKRFDGELQPQELQMLAALVNDPLQQQVVEEAIQHFLENPPAQQQLSQEQVTEMVARITSNSPMAQELPAAVRPIRRTQWWWAAAAVLVLSLGSYWFLLRQPDAGNRELANTTQTDAITPGKTGAILTLADGSTLILDTLGNTILADPQGVKMTLENGELAYNKSNAQAAATQYNAVSTPKGRHFKVVLPDGTQVWLNAASSITYPTAFMGAERKVVITGEVYFEVAKNALQPFIVDIDGRATVQVLGTHFNINAYSNEDALRTTLLEGAISMQHDQSKLILAPGEQGILLPQAAALSIDRQVNTEKVMAWKNGLFYFDGASVEQVMRQLERWYDISVAFEGRPPTRKFEGKMSRNIQLEDLLEGLRQMDLKFRMEAGRKLVILPEAQQP